MIRKASIIMALMVAAVGPAVLPGPDIDPYNGVLVVWTSDGQGSCSVVAFHEGWWYAATARHVVEDWDGNLVTGITVDDEGYPAEIVSVSNEQDVALIRFKSPEQYRIYKFGRVDLGDEVWTVGYSRGAKLVYRGYVVSKDFDGHLAANGGVVPGCSGGALLDKSGRLVGVTVALPVYGYMGFDSTAMYVNARHAEALLLAAIGE